MSQNFPYKILDLTHTLSPDTPSWDGDCGFSHETKKDYDDYPTGVQFRLHYMQMRAGIGTHMDSPAHCIPNAPTIDKLQLEDLITSCIRIDLSHKMHDAYQVSLDDILDFEKKYSKIPNNSFVILYTSWDRNWNIPGKYHNNHQFPSVSEDVAELLLERNINGLGIDTLSPDLPESGFPVHKHILGAEKYIIENVANAASLPPTGSFTLAMPIKAANLTESPIRLIALTAK